MAFIKFNKNWKINKLNSNNNNFSLTENDIYINAGNTKKSCTSIYDLMNNRELKSISNK